MIAANRSKKSILFILASLFVLSLTGCASSEYLDALGPAIGQFNIAVDSVNPLLENLIADNALFDDPAWQSDLDTALSNWIGASKALQNLPAPKEDYVQLNDLVQELASESILAAQAYKDAIAAGDIMLMNDGGSSMDRVNELLPQINAEIDRINQ